MNIQPSKQKRIMWISATTVIVALLVYAFAYIYEMPGGLSDWRMSRANNLSGTMHIPLGKTPEEAVQKFRGSLSMQVIHRESINGGILLFLKRLDSHQNNLLQVEYTRKTWFGWKWGWGGGFSNSSDLEADSVLSYMNVPSVKNLSSTFPLVFGYALSPSVKEVNIEAKGQHTGAYNAKIIDLNGGDRLWFVSMNSVNPTSYKIQAMNAEGELMASKSITDPTDSGLIN